MRLNANINFLNLKSSSPSAISAGTRCHFRDSAAALPARAGSAMTAHDVSGRSWMQSPRPGIRRQRRTP
jgi:hypothetical protein